MAINIPYNNRQIAIHVPDDAAVYRTSYREPDTDARALVRNALRNPVQSLPFAEALKKSGARSAAIVVSDITRPIPYADFLDTVLEEIEDAAVPHGNIVILIATGMHRPSTAAERERMFGSKVCERYRIVDHHADKSDELVALEGTSWAGRPIELNRLFVEADFRIATGLVEPHFMAGFSGGRKAVCPGLCSLETVKAFHSFAFLDDPNARNGQLEGNPLHSEALSIARKARVGFCLNLVVDRQHRLAAAIAGDLEASHLATCRLVGQHACPAVAQARDVVLTSSGGYPLDATFYQCVKGMASCLPAVKKGGIVISIGSCSEGIGGSEYRNIMHEHSGRWRDFLSRLQGNVHPIKDQWQFQMQTKILRHVGDNNLIFVTGGLSASDLNRLSVNGIHVSEDHIQERVQTLLDGFVREGRSVAVIPEGPYCAPIA
ncbi:MAG: nickel-dependent lactate racemase [Kiritimatiellia bacterium]